MTLTLQYHKFLYWHVILGCMYVYNSFHRKVQIQIWLTKTQIFLKHGPFVIWTKLTKQVGLLSSYLREKYIKSFKRISQNTEPTNNCSLMQDLVLLKRDQLLLNENLSRVYVPALSLFATIRTLSVLDMCRIPFYMNKNLGIWGLVWPKSVWYIMYFINDIQ